MAKEDVQVIYEDHEDEYWMKPLREAIVNVGNSAAGALIRRQQYNVDFTHKAMDRAHQAYLTQLGIQSREKMDEKRLVETRRANNRTAKYQRKTNELNQRRVQMAEAVHSKQMDEHERILAGTDAAMQILDHDALFQIVGDGKEGFKATVPALEGRDALMKTVRQSPTVSESYWPQIKTSEAYAKKLAGRADFVMRLKKRRKNDPILASMVKSLQKEPDWSDVQQDTDLRKAISNTMMDETLWKAFLEENGLGGSGNSHWLDKKHHTDNFLNAAQMYKNMGITDWEFNPLDANQGADVKNYEENTDAFTKVYAKGEIEQLLQGISLQGGNEAFRNNVEHLSAKGLQYIHANKMLFKSPRTVVASIKKNVGIVARGLEQRGGKKFKPKGKLQVMLHDYFTNPDAEIQNQQSEAIFNYLAGATEAVGKGKPKASPTAYSLLTNDQLDEINKRQKLTIQSNEPVTLSSVDQQSVQLSPKLQGTLTDDTGKSVTASRMLLDAQGDLPPGAMGINKHLAKNLTNILNDPPSDMKAWVETLKGMGINDWATTDPAVVAHALATAVDKNNGRTFLDQKKEFVMKNKTLLQSIDESPIYSVFKSIATIGTELAEDVGLYDDPVNQAAAQVEAVQQFVRSNALTHMKQDPLFINQDGTANGSWLAALVTKDLIAKPTKITWQTIEQMKANPAPSLQQTGAQFERILEYMNILEEPKFLTGTQHENKWTLDQELVKLAQGWNSFQPLYKVNPDAVAQANE